MLDDRSDVRFYSISLCNPNSLLYLVANITVPGFEALGSIMQLPDLHDRIENWDMVAAALAVLGTAAVVLAKKW